MQAIDTNVLIRILVDDPEQMEQVRMARQFAKKTGQLYIPQIVQVELVWVLSAGYDISKTEIIPILKHLYENEAFLLQNEEQFATGLQIFQTSNADFSDCLIWAESHALECEIVTFDKKFAKLPNVRQLNLSRSLA